MSAPEILEFATTAGLLMLSASMALALMRMILAPSLPDRALALDLTIVLGMCLAGVLAVRSGLSHYLDIALVLGLAGFVATIALANAIHRRGRARPAPSAETERSAP